MSKKSLCLIFTLILAGFVKAQVTELRKIDAELTSLYKSMMGTTYEERYDSLAPLFKKRLMQRLRDPRTFDQQLDSLSTYITIRTSPDKKIKFYSWDDMNGGTWHNIECIAQLRSGKGKIVVESINSGNEGATGMYTDSRVYQVHEIRTNTGAFYLTFAWGTHGSGHEHQIIQVFRVGPDTLLKCACFPGGKDLVIEYPRSERANLTFNPVTNELSYREFEFKENDGFYFPTGRTITLRFVNGVFTVK